MLDRIGVQPGWACLDIGCGPRGITDLLSERVGPGGRVVGLDKDEEFLAYARAHAPSNVEFRHGDAYSSGLPADAFDLVHMRFVASTAGNPEGLLREAMRLSARRRHRRAAGARRRNVQMPSAASGVGSIDGGHARRYSRVSAPTSTSRGGCTRCFVQAGLTDVHYRPFLFGIRSTDPMADHLPSTVESIRATVLRLGLLTEAELPACSNNAVAICATLER